MARRRRDPNARYHAFLRRLRAGGRSNMYGAIPYLASAFELDRETAFRIVCEWIDQQPADGLPARQQLLRLPKPPQPSLFDGAPVFDGAPAPAAPPRERTPPREQTPSRKQKQKPVKRKQAARRKAPRAGARPR